MGGNSSKEEKFFKTKKGIKVKKMDEPNPSEPPIDVIEDEPEYFETPGQREQSQNKQNEENSQNNSVRHPSGPRSFQNTQIEEMKMSKPEEKKNNNLNIQRSKFVPSSQISYENQSNQIIIVFEFHKIIMKIMKIVEFHNIIMKIMKNI